MAEAPQHPLIAALHESQELVERIKPLLAGSAPDVQAATLVSLVATHIAECGLRGEGDRNKTERLWADLLTLHTQTVARLIPVHAKIIRAELLKSKC